MQSAPDSCSAAPLALYLHGSMRQPSIGDIYHGLFPSALSQELLLHCFTGIFYSISSGNVQVAIQAIIVALIPMLGFLIFSFDKKRNIKNIYGVLSSVLAVFLIIGLTEMHLGWGSVLSVILYFPIVFLSSMGIFSNIVDAKNKAAYSNR